MMFEEKVFYIKYNDRTIQCNLTEAQFIIYVYNDNLHIVDRSAGLVNTLDKDFYFYVKKKSITTKALVTPIMTIVYNKTDEFMNRFTNKDTIVGFSFVNYSFECKEYIKEFNDNTLLTYLKTGDFKYLEKFTTGFDVFSLNYKPLEYRLHLFKRDFSNLYIADFELSSVNIENNNRISITKGGIYSNYGFDEYDKYYGHIYKDYLKILVNDDVSNFEQSLSNVTVIPRFKLDRYMNWFINEQFGYTDFRIVLKCVKSDNIYYDDDFNIIAIIVSEDIMKKIVSDQYDYKYYYTINDDLLLRLKKQLATRTLVKKQHIFSFECYIDKDLKITDIIVKDT